MFQLAVTAVVAALSLFPGSASAGSSGLTLHNGQNITWDYSDSIVPENRLFGMGLLRTNASIPAKVTDSG